MESPFGGVFLSAPEGGVKSSFLLELEPLALESLAFESSELLSTLESLVSEEELSEEVSVVVFETLSNEHPLMLQASRAYPNNPATRLPSQEKWFRFLLRFPVRIGNVQERKHRPLQRLRRHFR